MNSSAAAPLRAAVVTTLRGALPVIDSFVRYHLAAGFLRLYLFFDDPADPALEYVRRRGDSRLTIFARGPALEAEWRQCVQFGYYTPHIAREVMARQSLNVEVCVQHALSDRIDWLLHIDADELFHCTEQRVPAHFAQLEAAGIERAVYPNYEAISETEAVRDYFREVTLFKINRNLLPGGRFTPAQQALADRAGFPPNFFLFYSNGKSAARVRPGLVPDGVHRFHARRFPRAGQPSLSPGTERVVGDARVLHYACCGFENFRDKYQILGDFADKWFGNIAIRDSIGDFHLAARDVMAAGDEALARRFYHDRAMLSDRATIDTLIAAGLLARIDGPADFLNGRLQPSE